MIIRLILTQNKYSPDGGLSPPFAEINHALSSSAGLSYSSVRGGIIDIPLLLHEDAPFL